MPTYRITAPDGKTYQIEGPPGATTEQVRAAVIKQNPHLAPKPTAAPQEAKDLSLGNALFQGALNLPRSTYELGRSTVQALTSPLETGRAIVNLGSSVLGKIGITDASPEMADQVGKFYKDRYGSVENAKRTFAKDPAGFLADASTILTGVGGTVRAVPNAMGRTGGVAGQAGQVIQRAGQIVDPLSAVGSMVKGTGKAAAGISGFTSGAGTRAVEEAAKAGYRGGETGKAFVSQMRPTGASTVNDVVDAVKPAVTALRQQRSQAYKTGMAGVTKDKTILNFNDIDKAVQAVKNRGVFKDVVFRTKAAEAWKEVDDLINLWKSKPANEFHTVEGMDKLKIGIGEIRDALPYGTPARNAADEIYKAVRAEVAKQAPDYARVMSDYETASDLLNEMEKTLSLNPKASIDTQVRKLQSILRNNANTNYGRRAELGEVLAQQGAPNLFPMLAGQAMSSWSPRGLSGALSGAGALYNVAPNILSGITPTGIVQMASTSPRVVGETAYAAGRVAGTPQRLASLLAKHGAELVNKSPELAMSVDRAKRLLSQGKKVDPQLAKVLAYQLGQFERATEEQE
jgi:hypothetical protein